MGKTNKRTYFFVGSILSLLVLPIFYKQVSKSSQEQAIEEYSPTRKPQWLMYRDLNTFLSYLTLRVFIESIQLKYILTRRQVCITHAPDRVRLFPLIFEILQLILIPNSVRRNKIDGRIRDRKRILCILQFYFIRIVNASFKQRSFLTGFNLVIQQFEIGKYQGHSTFTTKIG